MYRCIPNARFVTVLREPISQALSFEVMEINRRYYQSYPTHPCHSEANASTPFNKRLSLESQLRRIDGCVDTKLRHDITIRMIAQRIAAWRQGENGNALMITQRFITGRMRSMSPAEVVQMLRNRYFLVGVVEHLNEFLVLLALHQGWDLASLYYRRCKPTNVEITAALFKRRNPDLYKKLYAASAVLRRAYEVAKADFEAHVARLGEWFPPLVAQFERGLAAYQASHVNRLAPYKWESVRLNDGTPEEC